MEVLLNPNGIKIYNVSIGKSLPDWLSEKKKRSLRKDEEYRRRLELIQGLDFPTASLNLHVSKDKEFLLMTGVYPPQVKCFELSQLSQKFERHLDAEVSQFEILSEDYSKLVFLKNDRTVEFHARFGRYYDFRIPKVGRDMLYHTSSCDLIIAGAGNDIYRFNLEQGQFLNPLVSSLNGINTSSLNPVHELMAFGGEDAIVECCDPRVRKCVGSVDLNMMSSLTELLENDKKLEVSKIHFANDGTTMAVGTNSGQVLLYDLRAPEPFLIKDHQYGFPIRHIEFHSAPGLEKRVISADTKNVKVWDRSQGKVDVNIEPPADINDVCLFPDSGLFFIACEQSKALSYFVPALGPAPKWCSFLVNLKEELEEEETYIYQDFKFVTREELESLGLSRLVGSEYLKAYMHGFFIDMKLYSKLRAAEKPFEYEQYRKEKIQQKIEKEAETRIGAKKKMPKVNAKAATRIMQDKNKKSLLADERFKAMFENPDYQVDEEHEKFKFYHPKEKKVTQEDIEEFFDEVESDDEDDESLESEEEIEPKESNVDKKEEKKKLNFYEIKKGQAFDVQKQTTLKPKEEKNIPFSKRIKMIQKESNNQPKRTATGGMELTFVPQKEKQKEKSHDNKKEWVERLNSRRSIKELKLPRISLKKKRKAK